jgi:hypothetical protein
MKYIITENRLLEIFRNFMDSQYDLSYDLKDNRYFGFVDKNGDVFGLVDDEHFYYGYFSEQGVLEGVFGDAANELLLYYLRERFPDITIDGIE